MKVSEQIIRLLKYFNECSKSHYYYEGESLTLFFLLLQAETSDGISMKIVIKVAYTMD